MDQQFLYLRRHRIVAAALVIALSPAMIPARGGDNLPMPTASDNAPVCPCESLTNVALPNTTIDSAVTNSDRACRVTVSITHPPSGDRVRVFIALPLAGWNGTFQGTSGVVGLDEAIIRWVEEGVTPDKLIDHGPNGRTRPVFPISRRPNTMAMEAPARSKTSGAAGRKGDNQWLGRSETGPIIVWE